MGSPEGEAERGQNERRHRVMLTRGYWLAETACTQGLWRSVMGGNPSRFKGDERPVEEVSWEGVQEFIKRLKQAVPGLQARLPTEAEWEYACRSGSETAFSFGETITTEQVNYDGKHPYGGAPKGEYRQTTVDVKALPANAWGLYQMHGNVWEWCADWYGDYEAGPVLDPEGPEAGELRVLRGGGWFGLAEDARSARRVASLPGVADYLTGFRLALGRPSGGR